MNPSVKIKLHHSPQSVEVPMQEILDTLQCQPSESCLLGCKALQAFVGLKTVATAVDLFEPVSEKITACDGPVQKRLGRVGCKAGLKA